MSVPFTSVLVVSLLALSTDTTSAMLLSVKLITSDPRATPADTKSAAESSNDMRPTTGAPLGVVTVPVSAGEVRGSKATNTSCNDNVIPTYTPPPNGSLPEALSSLS